MKIQKSEQNWYMGYIFSREIDGNIIPQKVQNLVIRDYTQRQKKKFILSSTEYKMKKSFLVLNSLINKKSKKFDGIIIYSLFMLKYHPNLNSLFEKLKKNKIKLYCALEELQLTNKNQLDTIKKIFFINKKDMNEKKYKKK